MDAARRARHVDTSTFLETRSDAELGRLIDGAKTGGVGVGGDHGTSVFPPAASTMRP
jgi:hypothetical protein